MDPIETWHDAPEFERMEAKIMALEAKLSRLIEAAEAVELNWATIGWGYNPELRAKLKTALTTAKR